MQFELDEFSHVEQLFQVTAKSHFENHNSQFKIPEMQSIKSRTGAAVGIKRFLQNPELYFPKGLLQHTYPKYFPAFISSQPIG